MVEVYKILNKTDLANRDKLFTMATYQQTRGLFKRHSGQNVRANSFNMRVIDTRNSIPSNVVLAPPVDSFKNHLNNHWHGHPLKFEASCYIPGVQPTLATQRRNASSQATEWPT